MQAQDLGQIANLNGASFRSHNNFIAQAQATKHSGPIEPPVIYPNMEWADTGSGILKVRDTSNTRWWPLGKLGASGAPPEIYNNGAPIPPALSDAERARLSSFRTVTEYGAVGNGVVDDTAAINRAIAAMPTNGGRLHFPSGSYLCGGPLDFNKTGTYFGDGDCTRIVCGFETGDFINLTAQNIRFQNISVGAAVTRTGGYFLVMYQGHQYIFDTTLYNFYGGINIRSTSSTVDRCWFWDGVPNDAIAINVENNPFDVSISDILTNSSSNIGAGIRILDSGDVEMSRAQILHANVGLNVFANPGKVIASVWANNSFFDNCGRGCSIIANGPGAAVVRCLFDQCWFSSASVDHGVALAVNSSGGIVDGVDFNVCHVFLNAQDGIRVHSPGVKNVRVNGGSYANNGAGGISFANPGITDFSVMGVRSGNTDGLSGNGHGIFIAGGCNNYRVIGNDVRGNTIGNLSDDGVGPKVVALNLGA